jgi:hypothetical protein
VVFSVGCRVGGGGEKIGVRCLWRLEGSFDGDWRMFGGIVLVCGRI